MLQSIRDRFQTDYPPRGVISSERRVTCQLMLASIRASFATGLAERSPNSDLNRRIGSAILGAFRDDLFDSTGLVKSLWLERITKTANDTEVMIEELMRMDAGQESQLGAHAHWRR